MITTPYFAFVWKQGFPRSDRLLRAIDRLRRQLGLSVLVDSPQLLFLGEQRSPHVLPEREGCIIWGALFDRRSVAFEIRPADAELLAPAERFLTQFWGGYVAFRSQPDGVEIFRDPSGMVPSYIAAIEGGQIFTSRPAMLFELELLTPEIDWSVVTQALAFRDLRPARTALRGVSELLPGMRLMVGSDGVRPSCVWTPWSFSTAELEVSSYGDAARMVQEAVMLVAKSWTRRTSRPIVELSGGLDSSIVAASLASAGSQPLCATFIPISGDSDERAYARATADHHGLALQEVELDLAVVDVTRSDSRALPRPCARNFAQALDRPLQRLGEATGADMFFSGGGGDNVFCHLQSALPIVDLAKRRGFGAHFGCAAMDVAEIADITFWEVLGAAAKRGLEKDRSLPKPRTNRFLAEAAWRDLPWPAENPWIEAARGALPGKRRHVWALASILNHLEGFGRQDLAPICSPLLAQPVMETCLRIPTWLWFEGGQNRSVAREAFRDMLPGTVIGRRTKAAFDSLGARVVRSNVPILRELLLDGVLVRRGIANPTAIDAALGRAMADGELVVDLLAIADAEAWASAWGS